MTEDGLRKNALLEKTGEGAPRIGSHYFLVFAFPHICSSDFNFFHL